MKQTSSEIVADISDSFEAFTGGHLEGDTSPGVVAFFIPSFSQAYLVHKPGLVNLHFVRNGWIDVRI